MKASGSVQVKQSMFYLQSHSLFRPHDLKTGCSSRNRIPAFQKQSEATQLGGKEGYDSSNFQTQNQTSFHQWGLDEVCKIRFHEDQKESVVFMFYLHSNFYSRIFLLVLRKTKSVDIPWKILL